jgi:hypothetical protein
VCCPCEGKKRIISIMLASVLRYFQKNVNISVLLLTFTYCTILFLYPDNFKFGIGISFFFFGLLYLLTKDIFVSLLAILLSSSFFLSPAKTHTFEYASPREYVYPIFKEGIFSKISISISDFYGMFLLLWFLSQRLKQLIYPRLRTSSILALINNPYVTLVLVAWFIYFSFSLFSIVNYSVFPAFSLSLLVQYFKVVPLFLGIVYLFMKKRELVRTFFTILLTILLFVSVIGAVQFMKSFTTYGQSELTISYDVEESTGFTRIKGLSDHPNAHAFATVILLWIVLPFVIQSRNRLHFIVLFLAFCNVIFAQSRTIWAALLLTVCVVYIIKRKNVNAFLKRLLFKRYLILVSFVAVGVMILTILPRLQLTGIFFSQEGGGALRMKMIAQGWQLLQQSPWTGFGIGMGVRVFLDRMPNGYIHTYPSSVHMAFLQMALESGLPAVFAFFSPFYFIIRGWFLSPKTNRLRSSYLLSIVCCILIICIYYVVHPAYGQREYPILGIVVALGVSTLIDKKDRKYI